MSHTADALANQLCKKQATYLQRQLPQFKIHDHTVRGFVEDDQEKCVLNLERQAPVFDCKDYCHELAEQLAEDQSLYSDIGDYTNVPEPLSNDQIDKLETECFEECEEGRTDPAMRIGGMVFDPRTGNIEDLNIPGKCLTWGMMDDPEDLIVLRQALDKIGCAPNISKEGEFEGAWKHPHDWVGSIDTMPFGHDAAQESETPAVCFYHITRKPSHKCHFVEALSTIDKEV